MSNIVANALRCGKTSLGTTDETQWYVTFVNNEVKLGKVVEVEPGFFVLVNKRWTYFFDERYVIHMSPHVRPM